MPPTVAERQVRVLTAKKESLFTNLQNLYDLSRKLDDEASRNKFEIRFRSLEATRRELLQTVDVLNEASIEADDKFVPTFAVYNIVDEMCCNIRQSADLIERERLATGNSTSSSSNIGGAPAQVAQCLPRLPHIELPIFSGEIREWETFYSIFKNLIHDNKSLTDVDKIYYLVGRLRGSALGVCSGLPPTGTNYPIIWQSLVDKYQDERALANNYLVQIMDFKRLQGESSKNLELFLENVDSAIKALQKLGLPDLADFILCNLALSKLDSDTSRAFEMSKRNTGIPTYADLIKFVKEQSKILVNQKPVDGGKFKQFDAKSRPMKSFLVNDTPKSGPSRLNACQYCHNRGHYISRCDKFKRLPSGKRYETVKNNNWCFNCLSTSHGVRFCPVDRSCAECSKKHHILLHLGRTNWEGLAEPSDSTAVNTSEGNAANNVNTTLAVQKTGSTVLLPTVVVRVRNSPVKDNTARFLLDSGSQTHIFTMKCCKRLGIPFSKSYSSIVGIGNNTQAVKGVSRLIISSQYDEEKVFSLETLIVGQIAEKLPRLVVDKNALCADWNDIPLADESFYQSREIDGIIGAELFSEMMCLERKGSPNGFPLAVETVFGYVIMGKVPVINTFFTLSDEVPIENLMNKFWEIEQVPECFSPNPEDQECEKLFIENCSRDVTGRFTVALPFKHPPMWLGNSKKIALSRLLSLENKFNKDSGLRLSYNEVMKDFIDQGHMRLVINDTARSSCYYMPHHAVYKPESSSTPVRVVLDASSPSDSDVALNDLLFSGPKLQTDIVTLLINFRLFKIAMTADVRQLYRQINMKDEHCKFQRLLWRFDSSEEIQTYEVTTVAFGVKSSPYLALRTIKKLIEEEGKSFPFASSVIHRDLYMDDLVCSVSSESEALCLYKESRQIFSAGGFDLTKWSTNSDSLLREIPPEKQLSKAVRFQTDTKILGLQWKPQFDMLCFKLSVPDPQGTKRKILSSIARCYDPIGLIGPFIFLLKLLVKELWRLKLGWDDEPPREISKTWDRVRLEWSELNHFQVPRNLGAEAGNPVMVLAFGDASQEGYGAVVYLRSTSSTGDVRVNLVCAKSKVSPFHLVSIPRLELCAAGLLSKLVKHVITAYRDRVFISKIYAFSDSTTVLQWVNSIELKEIFVANRVHNIREQVPNAIWRHVSGDNNPADCLSRGLSPVQLLNHPCWLSGPSWVQWAEESWPVTDWRRNEVSPSSAEAVFIVEEVEEINPLYELGMRCSSWIRILRTIVHILRFSKILPVNKTISAADLWKAETVLIKTIQKKHFQTDIEKVTKELQSSSKFRKLRPFLRDGLLRVGGRLSYSHLDFDQKHPIILPRKDQIIDKLIDYYHKIHCHTGPHLLESLLRQKYWILAGRNTIRARVHACNHCFRLKPTELNPMMADLPVERVRKAKVFLHTGVDYFGPFNITMGRRRGSQVFKAYVCLFVCMSVKAVHLELVSSLSTQHFLQAFKRFLARRGPCNVLYSDRGSNFVGAKKILSELNSLVNSEEYQRSLETELSYQGVMWKLNPGNAPHMGGLWESNVKAAKTHIFRVIGEQLLTYEEFSTLLTQIEALLNSRPLCQLSADPLAPQALTPAHFLTLAPLNSLPAEDVTTVKISRLDRFQLIDRMVQDYWKRWQMEYLHTLQVRKKWDRPSVNLEIGTVVVLKRDNSPPLHWPLAVISDVHPGKDGIVRTVTVRTSRGTLLRPVVKVCPLPTQ